jgi:hypothetical protein
MIQTCVVPLILVSEKPRLTPAHRFIVVGAASQEGEVNAGPIRVTSMVSGACSIDASRLLLTKLLTKTRKPAARGHRK